MSSASPSGRRNGARSERGSAVPRGSVPGAHLTPETLAMLSALLGLASESRLGARMLGRLAAQLARALGVAALSIRLLDPSGRWLDLKASTGLSKRMRARLRRLPVDSPVGRALVERRRRLVRSGDLREGFRPWPGASLRRFGAGVVVPIRADRVILGTLGVGYHQAARPPASQIRFLEAFGRQLGTALQLVRARRGRRRARYETRLLRQITAALSANLELQAVLDMVTTGAARLTRARGAIVLLLSRDHAEFEVASISDRRFGILGLRVPASGSLSAHVVATGRSVRSRDAATDSRPMLRTLQRAAEVRGLLIVPLKGASGPIGTLAVSNHTPRLFSDHDRRILMQLGHQASIAIQNARLFATLRSHQQLLRQLYSQQSAVLEGERKRIAHELHDEMGPTLSAILMNLQMVRDLRLQNGALATRVTETEQLLTGIIEKIRELAYGLRPPMLEQLGLAESLRWMLETYFTGGRLTVDYHHSGAGTLDPELALGVYRIAQEALTNVVKHASATRVSVRLRISPTLVTLRVSDNGSGFDLRQPGAELKVGLGLASMRERAEHLRGRMEIRSAPGTGCQLTISCPLETNDARPLG